MDLDWFMLLAQLLNFILLLALLRIFLYRPILNVMEGREARIAENWSEAERVREEARQEAQDLARERQRLAQTRRDRLAEIEREAAVLREERLEEAQLEADQLRARLADAIERERNEALELLARKSVSLLAAELQAALHDLADANLQSQSLQVFLRRLGNLDHAVKSRIAGAGDPGVVTTAFELQSGEREELARAVRGLTGSSRDPRFSVDPRLLFGGTLTAAGTRIGVSARDRMQEIERTFDRVVSDLRRAASRPAQTGSARDRGAGA